MRMNIRRVRSVALRTALVAGFLITVTLVTAVGIVMRGRSGSARLPAECAVVFGATVHVEFDSAGRRVGSKPGPGITRRVAAAARLYRQGMIRRVFLTGGRGEGMQLSEAAVMEQVARGEGIPAASIVLEDQSTSTWENLEMTRPRTSSCATVIGISDQTHLARIEMLARMQHWNLPTYPADVTAGEWFEIENTAREALGILYYFFLQIIR